MALSRFPRADNLPGFSFWLVALICLSVLLQKPIYRVSRPYLYPYQQYFDDQRILAETNLIAVDTLRPLSGEDCRSLRVVDGDFELGFAIEYVSPDFKEEAFAQRDARMLQTVYALPRQKRENAYAYKLEANDIPELKKVDRAKLRLKPDATFEEIQKYAEERANINQQRTEILKGVVKTWSYEVEFYDCEQPEGPIKKFIQLLAMLSVRSS